MEKKKNQKANLEKSRFLFSAIGLIAAFVLMSFAFNWQSEKSSETYTFEGTFIPEPLPPMPIPEPPEPKPDNDVKKKMLKDIINMTDIDEPTEEVEIVFPDFEEEPVFIEIPEPTDTTYIFVTQMPVFPGGEPALRRFIAVNVEYPALAKENSIQGTIHLRFEVTKTGEIGKIEILNKKSDALLQNAATDVIRKLPKFKPGMQNGEYVNVWYSLPISFKLN